MIRRRARRHPMGEVINFPCKPRPEPPSLTEDELANYAQMLARGMSEDQALEAVAHPIADGPVIMAASCRGSSARRAPRRHSGRQTCGHRNDR